MATVTAINKLGIYEIAGPNWYKTVVKMRKTVGIKILHDFIM